MRKMLQLRLEYILMLLISGKYMNAIYFVIN